MPSRSISTELGRRLVLILPSRFASGARSPGRRRKRRRELLRKVTRYGRIPLGNEFELQAVIDWGQIPGGRGSKDTFPWGQSTGGYRAKPRGSPETTPASRS